MKIDDKMKITMESSPQMIDKEKVDRERVSS
jgi:hypothetical protein